MSYRAPSPPENTCIDATWSLHGVGLPSESGAWPTEDAATSVITCSVAAERLGHAAGNEAVEAASG